MNLKNMKYALVTGGARGLGRAICIKLASLGIPVIINYQSNHSAAEDVKSLILAAGGAAELLPFNVGDESQVKSAICSWQEQHQSLFIFFKLVNFIM